LLSLDDSLRIISDLKDKHANTNGKPFHPELNENNFHTFLDSLNDKLFKSFQKTSKEASIDSYIEVSFNLYLLSL
jgi:hypothetical protein